MTEFLAQTQSLSRAAESRRRFGSAGGAFGAGLPKTGFGLHGCRGRLAPDGHSPDVQMARLLLQTLTLPLAVEFAAAPDPASVTVDAAAAPLIQDFFKFWQASVGSGHAALGVPGAIPAGDIPVGPGGSLGQMWQEQLKAVHDDCGIDGVRFHGSFDDDMGPVATGCDPITGRQCTWNFTGLDVLYDGILAAGVKVTIAQNTRPLAPPPTPPAPSCCEYTRATHVPDRPRWLQPIVELSFMPTSIANCTAGHCPTGMHYRGVEAHPKSYEAWGDLVGAFAAHLVERVRGHASASLMPELSHVCAGPVPRGPQFFLHFSERVFSTSPCRKTKLSTRSYRELPPPHTHARTLSLLVGGLQ